MENIFKNKRILISSSFLALAILSFLVLVLGYWLFHLDIPSFAFIAALMGIVMSGGYLAALRSEPPW